MFVVTREINVYNVEMIFRYMIHVLRSTFDENSPPRFFLVEPSTRISFSNEYTSDMSLEQNRRNISD